MTGASGSARFLLDTHAVLWALDEDPRLPQTILAEIQASPARFAISDVSLWEIAIKSSLGKLRADDELPEIIERSDHPRVAITGQAVWATRSLPPHHRDPFDRLLVCQAAEHELILVTGDRQLGRYDVSVRWSD